MGLTLEQARECPPDRKGRYWCPFACHNKGYPAPKWTTLKGYLGHLEKCPELPTNAPPPPPPPDRPNLANCAICEKPIMEGDSVWQYAERIICCLECISARPVGYGPGHMDFAGLWLGDGDYRH